MSYEGQQTKLKGELLHMQSQKWLLQDKIAKSDLFNAGLEQELAAL